MRILAVLLCFVLFASCNQKEQERSKVNRYFDLAGYFKNEASRLTKNNIPIFKTVRINSKSEQKKLTIKDWEKEFSSFIDSDINKSSWKGSFIVTNQNNVKTYISNDEKIAVNKIEIREREGKVTAVKIFIHNNNDLYVSKDSLSYFPDSLYEIKKVQKIKLMEEKRYQVIGLF